MAPCSFCVSNGSRTEVVQRSNWSRVAVAAQLLNYHCIDNEKKLSERRKHCTLAIVRRRQKSSPRRRPPSLGRRTAKIQSAGDGHLHLQIQFGEDRCTQYRVIVVTDPQTNTQTNKQTRPITIHCAAKLSAHGI